MKLDVALLVVNIIFAYTGRGTFAGRLNTVAAALMFAVILKEAGVLC